jgi:hypothetical protein
MPNFEAINGHQVSWLFESNCMRRNQSMSATQNIPFLFGTGFLHDIEILGKLEQGRSGYNLLRQLAACSPEDLDTWNSLMQQWTATNAEIVLSELARRLTVLLVRAWVVDVRPRV